MILSIAVAYVSSSSTLGRLLGGSFGVAEEELVTLCRLLSEYEDGDGDEMWRGEWPGESSIVSLP